MNMTTPTSLPATTTASSKHGARIRHPRIASTIEECQLMLTAGASADLILVCGPTGVGKSTLGHFLVEEELKQQAEAMAEQPGFIPAIRVEAPASGEKEFSWRLFYQRILHALEGELDAPRLAYGVDPESGRVVRPRGNNTNRLSGLRTAVERSGVRREFEIAMEHGLVPILVAASGYMAKVLWDEVLADPAKYYPGMDWILPLIKALDTRQPNDTGLVLHIIKIIKELNK